MNYITTGAETLFKNIVELFISAVNKVVATHDEVIVGLPGGRTIGPLLAELKKQDVPWDALHIFLVDERVVPIGHPQRNDRVLRQELRGVLPEANIHSYSCNKQNPVAGVQAYTKELMRYRSSFDIVVLSAGEDGHIASLFPNHPSIKDESDFFILVDHAPKPPPLRMSSSKKLIQRSQQGILIFSGNNKKEAYRNFLDTGLDINKCPAKLIATLSNAYVITDIDQINNQQ
jgi:6-phosphogluconolactonase